MAGDEKISGPLDATRSNLYEIQKLVGSICDRLGVHPPQAATGQGAPVAEPVAVIDRVSDALDLTMSIRSRLEEVNEFISKI